MKLYLLKLLGSSTQLAGVNLGFVIAASSSAVARRIAAENSMSEGKRTWFMPRESSCEEIGEARADQKTEVVLQSSSADY